MTDNLFELEAPQDALGTTEAGPAHMQPPAPVSPLTKHWEVALEEFSTSGSDACRNRDITRELLALGAIRAVYWLALGAAEVTLAKEIAEWWAECEPLHGLGETIK
ncbi:hypothetical protein [Aeromonas rivipollensis]|uniref:hypothetical protein n=1 Tax=Aeromonas rivipollensis TaxID=948519 RepID=UPI00259FC1B6|nr:hypothetical protein [Aeromonas rivipollensis]MDM5094409.1 hypothetical protein [Aeromonas rivipollensis]